MKVKTHKDQIIKIQNEVTTFLRHIKKDNMIRKFKNKNELYNYIKDFRN